MMSRVEDEERVLTPPPTGRAPFLQSFELLRAEAQKSCLEDSRSSASAFIWNLHFVTFSLWPVYSGEEHSGSFLLLSVPLDPPQRCTLASVRMRQMSKGFYLCRWNFNRSSCCSVSANNQLSVLSSISSKLQNAVKSSYQDT